MIYLLDLKKVTSNLRPVLSTEYTVGKSNNFHPDGLFSEIIFGSKEGPERKKTLSYIDLHCKVVHPALVKTIEFLNKKAILAINREKAYKINDNGILEEDKTGDINSINSVIKNFDKIFGRVEESTRRIDMKNMLITYHKKNLVFIDKCIVMPAGYRDAAVDEVHGGLRIDPINDYYVKIIRQSMQLQSLSITSGPMYDILSSKMQQLIDQLYDFLIQKISKKEGLIRKNVLGKRADFTGRAVIVGGAGKIKIDEIGIPFRILVKIFEPFILFDMYNSGNVKKEVLGRLIKQWDGSELSIVSLRNLFNSIQKGFKINQELEDLVKASIIRVIKDKVVIAKRDPALHPESVLGFKPVMIDGDSIQLPIAKCAGFNADFDGDAMALYVPITKEAIEEVKDKMIHSNSMDSINLVGDDFSKDVVIGIYALTQDSPSKKAPIVIRTDEQLFELEPLDIIKYDGEVTTVGRVLFNRILPSKKYHTNKPLSKSDIKTLVQKIHKEYGLKEKSKYVDFCFNLVNIGVKYYTIMAPSFTLNDLLDIPSSIRKLKEQLKTTKDPIEASKIMKLIEASLKEYCEKKNTNIGLIGKAGGLKGGYNQSAQIIVSKGLIQTPDEVKIFPHSYSDGFTSQEFFNNGYSARQGMIDRVINTSDTGYLSRQLVFALQRVEADPRIKDCKTRRTFSIKVTSDVANRLDGRYIINKKGVIVPFNKKEHLGEVISLRSPLYCLSRSICRTCYGELLLRNKTRYVGILAGEILGEKLSQTIMRTFHVGGSINIKEFQILEEVSRIMSDSDKHFLEKSFKQQSNNLISLVNGEIEINKLEYKDVKKDIKVNSQKINLNYAYFKLKYLSYNTDITIDNKIEIDLKDKKVIELGNIIKIEFPINSVVFTCLPTPDIFSEKIKMFDSLFSGRSPWRNADHFALKIYNLYMGLGTEADLVHFEILASNLLRDKGNPSFPARLNKNYNPMVGSLKALPGLESWLQALSFENPKQSITTGLMYDRPSNETILEKLVTGNF